MSKAHILHEKEDLNNTGFNNNNNKKRTCGAQVDCLGVADHCSACHDTSTASSDEEIIQGLNIDVELGRDLSQHSQMANGSN